jgi:uncharacterized membrane protein YdjX (TVP38/TMEM64 family)
LQAFIVLTVFIPVDVILNVFGGYLFGLPLGFLLSMLGIMSGAICAFYISRLLGYRLILKFISEDRINKISDTLNSTKGILGLLIIYLIPGIPKDLMVYIAGFTPIKASKLFLVYALSRIPATLIEVSVGAQIQQKDITGMIITLAGLALFGVTILILQNVYKKKQSKKI